MSSLAPVNKLVSLTSRHGMWALRRFRRFTLHLHFTLARIRTVSQLQNEVDLSSSFRITMHVFSEHFLLRLSYDTVRYVRIQ